MPALVKVKSLTPFFTSAADDKYSRRRISMQQLQFPATTSNGIISKFDSERGLLEQKIFSAIFIAFIKPTSNLKHFEK